jgi:hypothetical protein
LDLLAKFRKDSSPALVVARRAPLLRLVLISFGAVIALLALYIVYELGRYDAGYDRQAASQQRTELEVQIEHLERADRELRTKLAEADTITAGRAHEQAEEARAIGELQAQVARQSQELAFYRGVVAQNAASIGVKIEQLHITAGAKPGTFQVHLSLVRAGRPDALASGTVHFTLLGSSAQGARSLDLAALTAGRQHELRYDLRYLESLDQELAVPAAFRPEQLDVELQSSRRDIAPLSQTFLWTVEPSP